MTKSGIFNFHALVGSNHPVQKANHEGMFAWFL
jgi:hypothetical protein